ncbi:isopropylmalate isomerase [Tabrizicola piscis]|uniref:Isopropylmalate isomerase n=1 Tax=Tabrizicola piscis TaxID=2494374 RepID=A0A3S8UA58_9RHOB|nr:isopropylmalate isomerase [Tabrizicola piscis]AZL60507.1 isopropylmalate isomerase [Tabrizicola piscis]
MSSMFPCAFSPWSPGIGDNHVMGWLTVAVYLVAAFSCAVTARYGPFPARTRRREQLFWWFCAVALVLLAANKQLDLQSLLTSVARCVAVDQGWYENRRMMQRVFILAVAAAGALGFLAGGLLMRGTFARTGLPILGLGLVCTFVAIRAASFHHVDILIDTRVLGLRLNWVLELPGPLLIWLASIRAGRQQRPDRP